MKNSSRLTLALALSFLFFCAHARAQEEDAPKVEVGAQFSSLSVNIPDTPFTETQAGFGGRVTYNFTDSFAVEAEGNFFPKESAHSVTTGGRIVQAQFGVKAGKRFERFGVFAKARPGFLSSSEVAVFAGTRTVDLNGVPFTFPLFEARRQTRFTTDVGGVLEFYPSRKIVTRFDFGDTMIRYGGHTVPAPPVLDPTTISTTERPAKTEHNFQFTAGVAYRFGGGGGSDAGATVDTSPTDNAPRFEVGVQFTSLTLNAPRTVFFLSPSAVTETSNEPGFGGRVTYNINDSVAVEAEGNFFTTRTDIADISTGGHPFQMQFGAKVGRRFDRFGVFAKARPGFVGFSSVTEITGTDVETFGGNPFFFPNFRQTRKLYFSTDVGGVLEFYPSRRLVTRFDFGDTIIRYGERNAFFSDFTTTTPVIVPAEIKHNFQFSAGLGLRF